MVKDVWWDNVIFREFAAHFISMSDEQVVRDIRESVVKVINLDESGDSFGANMVRRAKERLCGRHDVAVQNGTKGGRPRKETTADGDTREDSQDRKSGTSANNYGDAATREGAEAATCRESGASEPTTVSTNIGNGQGTEAPRRQGRAGADSVRLHSAPARSRAKNSRCPNSREEFHAFVADNNLHENLAEEWYAMHEARGWVDRDGKPIKDWKGALYNYCTKTEQKRRTA